MQQLINLIMVTGYCVAQVCRQEHQHGLRLCLLCLYADLLLYNPLGSIAVDRHIHSP